jgi:hypothetical protein
VMPPPERMVGCYRCWTWPILDGQGRSRPGRRWIGALRNATRRSPSCRVSSGRYSTAGPFLTVLEALTHVVPVYLKRTNQTAPATSRRTTKPARQFAMAFLCEFGTGRLARWRRWCCDGPAVVRMKREAETSQGGDSHPPKVVVIQRRRGWQEAGSFAHSFSDDI